MLSYRMPDEAVALQDLIANSNCFGCGSDTPEGLQVKSSWAGESESERRYQPEARHAAAEAPLHLRPGMI